MDSDDEPFSKRDLPDGRVAHVLKMLIGKGRLCVARAGVCGYDDGW